MVKQSSEKSTSKNQNSNKINEIKVSLNSQNLTENKIKKKNVKKESMSIKTDFIKKECVISDIENLENVSSIEKNTDNFDNLQEKNSKLKKKSFCKLTKETEENRMEFLANFSHLRLSQSVIVNSVLKSTKIDQNLNAILPESLNLIYNKFINNKHYTDYLHLKDDFFCGVGLFGINIEEKIYNKRKALEDSLKRGIRLRPNPKPTKLFDGTVINRPSRNYNHGQKTFKSVTRPIVLRGKTKYNLFNIGIDSTKKKIRRPIRKPIKKKLNNNNNSNRGLVEKTELKKEIMNSGSSEDEPDDLNAKSIAFTRPKRQQKVPKLDFKYCYGDRMTGVVTGNRKFGDSNSDEGKSGEYGRDVMEIVDSDSSSVVEVSPPNDGDLSEESDSGLGKSKENQEKSKKAKCTLNMRKGWRPKESKALNLLDKLRLGLQCRIIQTEHDIIIQNLSLEDLATLQSRIQGLATFKNIEAEYDKNGQETARATIDRKLLNLPTKSGLENEEMKAPLSRKYEESLKRKPLSSQIIKYPSIDRKKLVLDDVSKALKTHPVINGNYKPEECPSVWIRPKGRSVKKVRKLYTQSGSTPNILSRSQMANRADNHLMTSSRTVSTQSVSKSSALSFSQASPIISTDSTGHNQHTTAVSFYSQLSTMASSIITPVSVIAKPIMSNETLKSVSTLSSTSVAVQVTNVDVTPIIPTATTIMATAVDSLNANTVTNIVSNSSLTPPSIVLESLRKSPIAVEKILPPPPPILLSTSNQRTIDLVSPATAMSASQLLMLKRGGSQTVNDSGSASNSVTSAANSTDQLYTNQILKPFKKTLVTSSPPKLELDDEEVEADFELTPSMITQVKNIAVPITLSNSQTIQNKHTFLSKPLIQASGILPNSRRTISLANTPLFQAQNSLLNSPNQLQSCCVSASNKSLTVVEKPIVCVVPTQTIGLPNTSISTTANNTNSINTNITNQNTSPNQNIKFKQRKWTHNFHTSNSINFREVLCTTRSNNVQPILNSHVQLSISNSVSSVNSAKTIPNTISTNIINPLRTPDKSNQIPSKGSSAVLKSLLVGSHSSNDLCNLNKSANWASKYLSSTSSLQDSSKIKWQVGGTVITSLPQNLMSPVSKESTPLEVVNSNSSK